MLYNFQLLTMLINVVIFILFCLFITILGIGLNKLIKNNKYNIGHYLLFVFTGLLLFILSIIGIIVLFFEIID